MFFWFVFEWTLVQTSEIVRQRAWEKQSQLVFDRSTTIPCQFDCHKIVDRIVDDVVAREVERRIGIRDQFANRDIQANTVQNYFVRRSYTFKDDGNEALKFSIFLRRAHSRRVIIVCLKCHLVYYWLQIRRQRKLFICNWFTWDCR